VRSGHHRLRPLAIGIVVLTTVWLACTTSSPARTAVQTLGFLEDYDQLGPGREGQARLLFIDDTANFSIYERLIVDRVVAWRGGAQEESLASSFDAALREQLATEFDLVEAPGPATLRLRSAIAMKTPSLLGVEVELLDAASGARLVAAVNDSPISGVDHERARAQQKAELVRLAGVIRSRLAAFRSFDAEQRARGEEEE
jgi:hypothetical protein